MPRYHFNVYDGKTALDRVGTELDNFEEAKLEAVWLAGRMILENFEHVSSRDEWRLEVTDGRGLLMICLDFCVIVSPAYESLRRSLKDLY